MTVRSDARTSTTRAQRFDGLDVLRVFSSCAVVVGHILAWFSTRDQEWSISNFLEEDVAAPLHLNPHLAFIGVGLFFLMSGIVVTHVTYRERPGQFLFRRLTRIMPLLWALSILTWLLINAGVHISSEVDGPLSLGDLLRGLVLLNFLTQPMVALIGVSWTLLHQIAFYLLVAATIPLLRKRAWLAPTLAAVGCYLALLVSTATRHTGFGENSELLLHTLGQTATYIPIMCIGQVISLVHTGRLGTWPGLAIGAAHYLVFLLSDRIGGFTFQGPAMPRTVLLLILIVLLMLKISGPISRSRIIKEWSRRTYAVYLVHMGCVIFALDTLVPVLGPTLGVVCALLMIVVVTELVHRTIERPVEKWFRQRRSRSPNP